MESNWYGWKRLWLINLPKTKESGKYVHARLAKAMCLELLWRTFKINYGLLFTTARPGIIIG